MNLSKYTSDQRSKLLRILEKRNITIEDILERRVYFGTRVFTNAKCEFWLEHRRYWKSKKEESSKVHMDKKIFVWICEKCNWRYTVPSEKPPVFCTHGRCHSTQFHLDVNGEVQSDDPDQEAPQ
jgi:hypothetical protein